MESFFSTTENCRVRWLDLPGSGSLGCVARSGKPYQGESLVKDFRAAEQTAFADLW